MKTLLFLLICGVASGETLNQQLRAIARGADRVELTWRPEISVELAGLTRVKKVYTGDAIGILLSRLAFAADVPKAKKEEPPPPGTISIRIPNCYCDGTHLLRFFSHDRLIAEVAYLHGINLRAGTLDGGADAELTEESQKWLQAEADWKRDVEKIEELQRKKKVAAPVATAKQLERP
jgi:hypothetical protein